MNKDTIKNLIINSIICNQDKIDIVIDKRAKIIITLHNLSNANYLSVTTYVLDGNEIHFATLRNFIDRLFVENIDKHFEENIWLSNSAHCIINTDNSNLKNTITGLIELVADLYQIDVMDIKMCPHYHKNQWLLRNPYVNHQIIDKRNLSAYQKKYIDWIDEGIKNGYMVDNDILNDNLLIKENYNKELFYPKEIIDDYLEFNKS